MIWIFYLVAFAVWIALAAVCFDKGKPWMATCGLLFCGPLLIVGAIRLAKPNSGWARRKNYAGHPWKMKLSLNRYPKEALIVEHEAAHAAVAA